MEDGKFTLQLEIQVHISLHLLASVLEKVGVGGTAAKLGEGKDCLMWQLLPLKESEVAGSVLLTSPFLIKHLIVTVNESNV